MPLMRALLDAAHWRPKSKLPTAPRPLTLLPMSAGGCEGCQVELSALRGAAYDLARHDIRFVETPHDAELLLITGVVTRAMAPWLRRNWEAMPAPKGVIAIGDCALGAGPFAENYAILGGVLSAGLNGVTRCDVALRGCPPSPEEILRGLLMLSTGQVVSA
ncbi:NADH-quinone oxidoreductase subunit B family protein [Kozakia baliensis]|uniref:Uncharacterized protein n=1 Tax=Kozakia baliensis TaxID=153496 RepID=A0A1D8UUL5_9PROT|nr:hypothetical protein [Kozakia baliensis]AOX17335.1 hypothetical protein A0U89_09530 [Kozakia baliensis]GEL63227.1 hypothetical protein KBA01_05130 [Kozakia baliensis]